MQVTLTLLPSERPKLFERVLAVLRAIRLKLPASFSAIFKKKELPFFVTYSLPGPEVIKLFSCSTQLSMKF